MSEYAGKYWRLVESTPISTTACIEVLDPRSNTWLWWANICSDFDPHELVLLNSLLANKERFADGELDWSGLSKHTSEALRELGVEIPKEEP